MFLWQMLVGVPYSHFGTYDRKSNVDRFEFYKCSLFDESISINIDFKTGIDQVLGYSQLPIDCNLIVLNKELTDVISKFAKDCVQFIPAKINNNDLLGHYFAMNPLHSLPLLDRDRSVYSLISNTNSIMSISKYVVKNDSMSNQHLVRNADYMVDVVISNELADCLTSHNIRGLNMTRLISS